ncbi:hypothetical protein L210DRAFT_3614186 [Boletus edulis BED1]|uniref:Uncharacterized protein n=1 Tax=Boletus edulis BED1 TaxID=1328754 RepID=A0AAD4BKM6_BOLED|nr:hypothetical protein L210DRAFT_3614186 [Boletus edulis BED1]
MSAQFNNISWPSLYSPGKEVGFIGPPIRPGGYYLSDPDDVFKFTLYWTLIFHLPFNFVAGMYAFCNFLFPPAKSVKDSMVLAPHVRVHAHSLSESQSHAHSPRASAPIDEWLKPPRLNPLRSRWTFALLVLLAFLVISLLSAVVGAAVLAFVIVGVYRAGGFYMSTWIPFIWAVIQSLIALLEIWPSVIDII